MNKRALITGIAGFAASHLTDLLLKEGWEVYGTKRPRSRTENIAHVSEKVSGIVLCDITDAYSVRQAVLDTKPDVIFHLAAQSYVPLSWSAPHMTMDTNVNGTINVLEAARLLEKSPIVHIASSSQIYGNAPLPFDENTLPNPNSPYDVSKLAQEMVARSYCKSYGLRVRITRAFNITGPRRQEFMAESSFAKQIVAIERGQQEYIKVGNLEATRDFIDVQDAVNAYLKAAELGEDGKVYIVASGIEHTMREVLDMLISFSTVEPKVIVDPERLRPSETPRMRGDNSTMRSLGWEPTIPLHVSLRNLLDYWRSQT